MRPLVLTWIVSVLVFAAPAAERLNVVFFLIDDLGWTDLGCYAVSYTHLTLPTKA